MACFWLTETCQCRTFKSITRFMSFMQKSQNHGCKTHKKSYKRPLLNKMLPQTHFDKIVDNSPNVFAQKTKNTVAKRIKGPINDLSWTKSLSRMHFEKIIFFRVGTFFAYSNMSISPFKWIPRLVFFVQNNQNMFTVLPRALCMYLKYLFQKLLRI